MIDLTILLGAFLTGAAAGFLVLLRVGSAQEGRWLSAEAADPGGRRRPPPYQPARPGARRSHRRSEGRR
jgi:hypothetical protein